MQKAFDLPKGENSAPVETVKECFVKTLVNYCENSTIHGVRYFFTTRQRHWSERLFWFLTVGLSLLLCGLSIKCTWFGWQANPIKMNINGLKATISDIPFPFPTVTICPEAKSNKNIFNISAALNAPELSSMK